MDIFKNFGEKDEVKTLVKSDQEQKNKDREKG